MCMKRSCGVHRTNQHLHCSQEQDHFYFSSLSPIARCVFIDGMSYLVAALLGRTHGASWDWVNFLLRIIVYDLKFVGPCGFNLVAPMPEQLKTTTLHLVDRPGAPNLLTPKGNALLWSQFVLGWVQQN